MPTASPEEFKQKPTGGVDDPADFMEVQTAAGPVLVVVHEADLPVFVYDVTSTGWVFDADGNRCRFAAHVRLMVTRQDEFRVLSEGITITC